MSLLCQECRQEVRGSYYILALVCCDKARIINLLDSFYLAILCSDKKHRSVISDVPKNGLERFVFALVPGNGQSKPKYEAYEDFTLTQSGDTARSLYVSGDQFEVMLPNLAARFRDDRGIRIPQRIEGFHAWWRGLYRSETEDKDEHR
jgi:hypothetical protein